MRSVRPDSRDRLPTGGGREPRRVDEEEGWTQQESRADAGATPATWLSRARMQSILDGLADGVVVADSTGRLQYCNRVAERLLGTGLPGTPLEEWGTAIGCLEPDGETPCQPHELPLARALKGQHVIDAEVLVRNPQSPAGVVLSVNAVPLVDAHDQLQGSVSVVRDVTARKREQQQLELLSKAVEQTADCVLVTDAAGRIEYVNPGFERVTGYSASEAIGATPAILRSGEHEPEFYQQVWTTLHAGQVFRGTFVNRRRDGELFYSEQTITPLRDAAGVVSHFVSVGKDVTGQRHAAQRESGLLMARRVQQRLYPAAPPRLPGLDICGRALVADVTGGDYYDFLKRRGLLSIAIGDVSGHGIDSALVMSEMRAVLRSTARNVSDPGEILGVVNGALVEDTEDSRFATLLLAELDLESRQLRYASAGHTPGYLLDRSGGIRVELGATAAPLGLFEDLSFATREGFRLEQGETLVLVTDGFTESESPAGNVFGWQGVLEVVRSGLGQSCETVVDAVYDAVRAFRGHLVQQDDMTIVVCAARS